MEDRRIDGKLEQMWMRLENWKFGFSLCEWMENWKSSSTIRYDGRLYYTTMRITQIQHTYYACVEMAYGRSHSTTDLAENIQINNSIFLLAYKQHICSSICSSPIDHHTLAASALCRYCTRCIEGAHSTTPQTLDVNHSFVIYIQYTQ